MLKGLLVVFQWISFIIYGFRVKLIAVQLVRRLVAVASWCAMCCCLLCNADFILLCTCSPHGDTINWNTAHLEINRFNQYFLEIRDMTFTLFPTSFTENITSETTSISLSATYGCINLPVYFKWFVVVSLFLFEIC